MLVADASVVIAALVSADSNGEWAADVLATTLMAPAVLPFECANALRRLEASGALSADVAAQALADVDDLRVELWPFSVLAPRVWELRGSLTSYDASYVALAAELGVPLATLDRKLVRAAGGACRFLAP